MFLKDIAIFDSLDKESADKLLQKASADYKHVLGTRLFPLARDLNRKRMLGDMTFQQVCEDNRVEFRGTYDFLIHLIDSNAIKPFATAYEESLYLLSNYEILDHELFLASNSFHQRVVNENDLDKIKQIAKDLDPKIRLRIIENNLATFETLSVFSYGRVFTKKDFVGIYNSCRNLEVVEKVELQKKLDVSSKKEINLFVAINPEDLDIGKIVVKQRLPHVSIGADGSVDKLHKFIDLYDIKAVYIDCLHMDRDFLVSLFEWLDSQFDNKFDDSNAKVPVYLRGVYDVSRTQFNRKFPGQTKAVLKDDFITWPVAEYRWINVSTPR